MDFSVSSYTGVTKFKKVSYSGPTYIIFCFTCCC